MHEPTHQGHSTPTPSLTEDANLKKKKIAHKCVISYSKISKIKADSSKTGGHSRLFFIQTVENGQWPIPAVELIQFDALVSIYSSSINAVSGSQKKLPCQFSW